MSLQRNTNPNTILWLCMNGMRRLMNILYGFWIGTTVLLYGQSEKDRAPFSLTSQVKNIYKATKGKFQQKPMNENKNHVLRIFAQFVWNGEMNAATVLKPPSISVYLFVCARPLEIDINIIKIIEYHWMYSQRWMLNLCIHRWICAFGILSTRYGFDVSWLLPN